MAGINFTLGIDGSKARAQAEAVGRDVKNGVERGTKGSAKQTEELTKALGTARSNAKQLHEDLLGMAAGGTKGMSSVIGLAGDLSKAVASPAGAITALIAGFTALGKAVAEVVAASANNIRSDLVATLEVARDKASAINEVNLEKFRKELTATSDAITRQSEILDAMQSAYTELLDSESEKRIAIVDNQLKAGIISNEQAEERKLAIRMAYLQKTYEMEKEYRERQKSEAEAQLQAANAAKEQAQIEFDKAGVDKGQVLQASGRITNEVFDSTEFGTWLTEGRKQAELLAGNLSVINNLLEKYGLPKVEAPKDESYSKNYFKDAFKSVSPLKRAVTVVDTYAKNTEEEVRFEIEFKAAVQSLLEAIKTKSSSLTSTRETANQAEKNLNEITDKLVATSALLEQARSNQLDTLRIEGQTAIIGAKTASKPESNTAQKQDGPLISRRKSIPNAGSGGVDNTNDLLKQLVKNTENTAKAATTTAENTKGLQPK